MGIIDKAYFMLEEIEERWQLPHRDVVYLAENGLLKLSVRLFNVRLESGDFEDFGNGRWNRIPTDQRWFSGLQDLRAHDAFRLFRDGQARIDQFAAPAAEYCELLEPTESLTLRIADVVVRREERDRVERQHGLARAGTPRGPVFQQVNDYSEVRLSGLVFHLGQVQSRVVKQLHRAALTGEPWCIGKVLLTSAGSACTRLADLFKSQRHWRQLIESDRRGRYRLRCHSADPHRKIARSAAFSRSGRPTSPADPPAPPLDPGFRSLFHPPRVHRRSRRQNVQRPASSRAAERQPQGR
jgi:hypothetical protein